MSILYTNDFTRKVDVRVTLSSDYGPITIIIDLALIYTIFYKNNFKRTSRFKFGVQIFSTVTFQMKAWNKSSILSMYLE